MSGAGDTGVEAGSMQEFHAGQPGGTAHCHQTANSGTDPVVHLISQFVCFVELHRWDVVLVFLPCFGVGYERFHDGGVSGEGADDFESEKRAFEKVINAEKEDEIEFAEGGLRQFAEVENAIRNAGREGLLNAEKAGKFNAVHRGDVGSMAFGFETEPAVPGSDIQQAGSCHAGGKRKPGVALLRISNRL